jgi:hypothetical protein
MAAVHLVLAQRISDRILSEWRPSPASNADEIDAVTVAPLIRDVMAEMCPVLAMV